MVSLLQSQACIPRTFISMLKIQSLRTPISLSEWTTCIHSIRLSYVKKCCISSLDFTTYLIIFYNDMFCHDYCHIMQSFLQFHYFIHLTIWLVNLCWICRSYKIDNIVYRIFGLFTFPTSYVTSCHSFLWLFFLYIMTYYIPCIYLLFIINLYSLFALLCRVLASLMQESLWMLFM